MYEKNESNNTDKRKIGVFFKNGKQYEKVKLIVCLFVFALRPKSTAMVIAGRSVDLTTLFSWASLKKQLTSTSCTYFRL